MRASCMGSWEPIRIDDLCVDKVAGKNPILYKFWIEWLTVILPNCDFAVTKDFINEPLIFFYLGDNDVKGNKMENRSIILRKWRHTFS